MKVTEHCLHADNLVFCRKLPCFCWWITLASKRIRVRFLVRQNGLSMHSRMTLEVNGRFYQGRPSYFPIVQPMHPQMDWFLQDSEARCPDLSNGSHSETCRQNRRSRLYLRTFSWIRLASPLNQGAAYFWIDLWNIEAEHFLSSKTSWRWHGPSWPPGHSLSS